MSCQFKLKDSTTGNLALIGARGAGKSKLARKLSKHLGWALLSIDQLISYECEGRSISMIVADLGWSGFRDIEYSVLRKVCAMRQVLIDCGGGILVEAPAQAGESEIYSMRKSELLKTNAQVVYVKRNWEWMMMKAGLDPNRPDLGGDYRQLLERRLPWYESSADYILEPQANQSVSDVMDELVLQLFEANNPDPH